MPDMPARVVINTGPIVALVAALEGDLALLGKLYESIVVPREVWEELGSGGPTSPELQAINSNPVFAVAAQGIALQPLLAAQLDRGEASVVQTALNGDIATVVIDEKAGRRLARLNGLQVTGSLGVLMRAKREGLIPSLTEAIERMRLHGIWLSPKLVELALRDAREMK